MEPQKREYLISRIIAEYVPIVIDGKRYKVYHPNNNVALKASEIYLEEYEKATDDDIFDDEDAMNVLIGAGVWSDQHEKELLEIVPGHIEYWKVELYTNLFKTNTSDTVRKYLKTAKEEYNRLYNIRHSLDSITRAGYASYVKNMYIISTSTRYKGKKINWNKVDLNVVMNKYYVALIDSDTIRMLARSHPWAGVWPTLKLNGRVFQNKILTTEQQALLSWSSMYDKIYESPECPSDEVINDDDMLDGWLIIQRRKREKDRNKQELEQKLGGKLGNADDVFLIAETPQDAQKIESLNEPHMSRVKKQRMAQIKASDGEVLEQQLSDVKRKRAMQLRQAFGQTVKGR